MTAPTFTTRPTTEQLHHYAGRHYCRTATGDETLVQVKEVSAGAGQLETSRIRDAILHAMHATAGPIVIVTDGNVGSGLQFTGWDEGGVIAS